MLTQKNAPQGAFFLQIYILFIQPSFTIHIFIQLML